MVKISTIVILAFGGLVAAAPLRLSRRAFTLRDYADFQISDGTGGNAQAEANAVFVDSFDGVDLATVDSDMLDAMNTMREAAEDAETSLFNPAIDDASSGAAKDALQVGKTKNKVLKLTGEVQVLNIKIAQAKALGGDTSDLKDKLMGEQKKLTTNISLDKKAAATSTTSTSQAASSTATASGAAFTFAVKEYKDFQISDSVAGNALAEANAIFVDPFEGVDLATVDSSVSDAVETMHKVAEDAETLLFDPAIDAASGAASGTAVDALQNGKIKNKVLKLTGEVQVLNIKIATAQAKGEDMLDLESKLTEEQCMFVLHLV